MLGFKGRFLGNEKEIICINIMASMMAMGVMVGCGGGGSDEPAPTGDGERNTRRCSRWQYRYV